MTEKTISQQIARLILDGSLSKTEDRVTITCENGDAANELLDLLCDLLGEQIPFPDPERPATD